MTHYHPYHRRRTPTLPFPISTYLRRSPTLRHPKPLAKAPSLPRINELDIMEDTSRTRQSKARDSSNSSSVSSFDVPQRFHLLPSQSITTTNQTTFSFARPTFNVRQPSQDPSLKLAPLAKSFPTFPSNSARSASSAPLSGSISLDFTGEDPAATSAREERNDLLSIEARKAYKLPPSGCGVCATTDTAEWRRGPAGIRSLCNACGLTAARRARDREVRGDFHPATIEEIKEELRKIGFERFKPASGHYQLPAGSLSLIIQAQRRTRIYEALSRASSTSSKDVKMAAGALVKLTRRASINSPPIPARPVRKELRRNSYDHPGLERTTRYNSNHSIDLPPSSTYMPPPQPQPMAPTVPSIVVTAPQNSSTWFYSSQHCYLSTQSVVSHERSRIDGAYYPEPQLPPHDSFTRPRFVNYSSQLYSPPPPTSSLRQMNLTRLTEPSYPNSFPRMNSIESYSLSAMAANSNSRKTSF
ncbi:hypothetical protein JCM3765_004521 [Sporobolomyces pararoseus]